MFAVQFPTDGNRADNTAGVTGKPVCRLRSNVGHKGAAQSKVVRMMIPGVGQNAGEMDPQKARDGA
jgi:hypothetical protein